MELLNNSGEIVQWPAKRIVSLVPSLTELLYDLTLENETIGITKFCIHPDQWFRTKQRIGGTKNVRVDEVIKLNPDLVIASKEENVEAQVAAIAKHCPVLLTEISSFEEALESIYFIGKYCGRKNEAAGLVDAILGAFADGGACIDSTLKVAYCIWREPWMFAGGDTFINSMLTRAGFGNALAGMTRYPSVSLEKLAALKPDLVFLSSEPYPFRQQHLDEVQLVLPGARVLLVDGELFSWYGSRMLHAPQYFATLRQQVYS